MRVLVVDDNETAIAIIRASLTKAGYEVLTATNGHAALDILRQGACRLVVSDWMMPGIAGPELCGAIRREKLPGYVYFILLTAHDAAQQKVNGLAAGADDFIAKPFDMAELVARVRAGERILSADRAELQAEITLRRLAEKDLVEHRRDLERANRDLQSSNQKLSSLYQTAQRFVDNVSHEFRTPLTVIKGYAEAMSEEMAGPVNSQQKEFLGFVVDRTRDLAQMVDDLLDSSKIRAGTLRIDRAAYHVEQILETVRPMLLAKAGSNKITFDESLAPDLPEVFADAEKSGRVLVNLVVNAIKFSPENSTVTLWTRDHPAGDIEIGVTDQGPGISPDNLTLIFDRFKQFGDPQETSKGFGLGLNIARELVALNLGEIHVTSELGHGSTFSFTLPPNNPSTILHRYLEYLSHTTDKDGTLAVIRIANPFGMPVSAKLRGFIAAAVHPTDLVLPTADSHALMVIGRTGDIDQWAAQLHTAAHNFAARLESTHQFHAPTIEKMGHWPCSLEKELLHENLFNLLQTEVAYV